MNRNKKESRKGNGEDKQMKRRKMRENRAIIKNKHETDSGLQRGRPNDLDFQPKYLGS